MKLFIKEILAFLFVLVMFFTFIVSFDALVINNQYSETYQAMAIDKIARLKSIKEPKIILAGNSNVVFGFDSEKIEKELGMPVVNMGLHGGLGNAFLERMGTLTVNEGDIVIISHLSYDDDDKISDPALAMITLEWNKEVWPAVRLKDVPCLVRAYPQYFLRAFKLWSNITKQTDDGSVYKRDNGNKYGDILIDSESKMDFSKSGVNIPGINDVCIKRINRLNSEIKKRGATLLVAAYPIADGEYTPAKENYLNFEKELKEALDCDVISDFSNHFIPYEYFYDTQFHLTGKGAEIHTDTIIKELKAWMAENNR